VDLKGFGTKTSRQFCELRYGVHVAGGSLGRCVYFQFRLSLPRGIVNIDLACARTDVFVVSSNYRFHHVGGRRRIKEDRDREFGLPVREGIAGKDFGHLGCGAHEDTHRFPGVGLEPLFKRSLDFCLGQTALEEDIARGDKGSHRCKTGALAHRLQVAHGQFAGPANIHGTQQRYISRHSCLAVPERPAD
jgi:hypothetical protein